MINIYSYKMLLRFLRVEEAHVVVPYTVTKNIYIIPHLRPNAYVSRDCARALVGNPELMQCSHDLSCMHNWGLTAILYTEWKKWHDADYEIFPSNFFQGNSNRRKLILSCCNIVRAVEKSKGLLTSELIYCTLCYGKNLECPWCICYNAIAYWQKIKTGEISLSPLLRL